MTTSNGTANCTGEKISFSVKFDIVETTPNSSAAIVFTIFFSPKAEGCFNNKFKD